ANVFRGNYYALDPERGVGRAIIEFRGDPWVIDVAALRGDLESDLRDRDFTINALAVPLADEEMNVIYDPCGGIPDLQKKILRRCSPHAISHDPIRALRGIRQSLKYSVMLDPDTREDIRREGVKIVQASAERVRDEFFTLLGDPKPQSGLLLLEKMGLLPLIVPEVETLQQKGVWRFVLNSMEKLDGLLTVISPRRDDNIAANAGFGTFVYLLDRYRGLFQKHTAAEYADERTHRMILMFALVMLFSGETASDSAEKAAERAKNLKLSNQEIKRIEDVILFHHLPDELQTPLDDRQIYRFWRKTGITGVDVCLLAVVNALAEKGVSLNIDEWTAYLQNMARLFEGYESTMSLTPLVSGSDLIEQLGLERGPQIGELLEILREAQALGEFDTREAGLTLAKSFLKSRFEG
ncbi:MAG: hypothetical protein K8I82_07130, partial [Anaerolineae bacterium]|nr:hypothetical protein [Anaerolineae bacterium]